LKNLLNKGLVRELKNATLFSAEPFENILYILIEETIERQKSLQEDRKILLSAWYSMIKKADK
jgi:hypothetical protein